jgi:hypothetical protein
MSMIALRFEMAWPVQKSCRLVGAPPGFKPAANLIPAGIGHYTEADFIRALREGVRPSGAPIDPQMPVARITRYMTDLELRALYAYLRSVPPRPYGMRHALSATSARAARRARRLCAARPVTSVRRACSLMGSAAT